MWLQLGLSAGAVLVAAAVLRRLFRRRNRSPRRIDVGAVSESWLAEHRGKRDSDIS